MKLITLTTDFGRSEYVAQMKGVILGIAPKVRIIDISHDISAQSVIEGAFVLMSSAVHFKDGVHVGVVDPGVGSSRRAVVFSCKRGILVGPDNGLLEPAAHKLGLEACYEISEPTVSFISEDNEVSDTFHGRDIFAPVAARLAQGDIVPEDVGGRIKDFVKLDIMGSKVSSNKATGMIVRVDHFGNMISNLPKTVLKNISATGVVEVLVGKKRALAKIARTYSDGRPGELLLLGSSSGFVELSMTKERAADILCVHPGDVVEINYLPASKKAGKSRKSNPKK